MIAFVRGRVAGRRPCLTPSVEVGRGGPRAAVHARTRWPACASGSEAHAADAAWSCARTR